MCITLRPYLSGEGNTRGKVPANLRGKVPAKRRGKVPGFFRTRKKPAESLVLKKPAANRLSQGSSGRSPLMGPNLALGKYDYRKNERETARIFCQKEAKRPALEGPLP
jgi:hypothetical protein